MFPRSLVAIVLLIAIGLLAYATSWSGVFVFDDLSAIVGNRALDDWDSGWAMVRHSSRWLGDLTFLTNVQLGGRETWGFHAVNLAIHLALGIAIFSLVRRLLRQPVIDWTLPPWNTAESRRDAWIEQLAFTIAALWLVHPLTTQGVTYIVQRYEQLAALGIVLSLWCYSRCEAPRRPWLWCLLAAGCTVLALGAKQTGIAAPLLAVLYERSFIRAPWKQRLRERGLYYLLCLPAMGSALMGVVPARDAAAKVEETASPDAAQTVEEPATAMTDLPLVDHDSFAGFNYRAVTPWEYLRSQGNVLCYYMGLTIFPVQLCIDYGWPVAEAPVEWLPGFLAVGIVFAVGWFLWLRGSPWGFAILGPYMILGPTSSVIPIRDLAVEHRVYLPLAFWIGMLCVAGSWCVDKLFTNPARRRVVGRSIVVTLLVLAMVRTSWRNTDYHSAVRLWEQTATTASLNQRAFYNWGHELLNVGDAAASIPPLERALELSELPRNRRFLTANELADNHSRLGTAWHQLGDFSRALAEYDLAREIDPRSGLIRHNRANVLALLGRTMEADEEFRIATERLPWDAKVRVDWGNLYAMQENFPAAIELYSAALERDSEMLDALVNRGTASIQSGRFEAGRRDLEKARRRLPRDDPRHETVTNWLSILRSLSPAGGEIRP